MSDWIDVDKKLPNSTGKSAVGLEVLIFNNRLKKIFIASRVFLSRYGWVWVDDDNYHHALIDVSHWMALPEFPNDH